MGWYFNASLNAYAPSTTTREVKLVGFDVGVGFCSIESEEFNVGSVVIKLMNGEVLEDCVCRCDTASAAVLSRKTLTTNNLMLLFVRFIIK
jgi:hypothetical protein